MFVVRMLLLIVTDLDGTLLGYDDYSARPAYQALERCRSLGVPVIPATSKARTEMEPILRALELSGPYIVENGAALHIPVDHPFASGACRLTAGEGIGPVPEPTADGQVRLVLGTPRAELIGVLRDAAEAAGLKVRGLSLMDAEELAERTGLQPADAARALEREFSEPFVVEGEEGAGEETRLAWLAALRKEGARLGDVRFTLGDRLFHLQGAHTKGEALGLLMRIAGASGGGPWHSLAIGDSFNDLEMLAAADEAVLVRRHDGTWAPVEAVEGLQRTDGVGPAGWNEAVLARLPEDPPADSAL